MLKNDIKNILIREDSFFKDENIDDFKLPEYSAKTHYIELTKSKYFKALLALRHCIKIASDYYFGIEQKARNVDLFMITPSISSPMGPGSDSETIPIKFGNINSYLVDSSQFGFEPLLMNGMDKVYCYLPSMRGEDFDKRHLNQFFHCEAEIKGNMDELMIIVESYVKFLCETFLNLPNIIRCISLNSEKTIDILEEVISMDSFKIISFDEAVELLIKNGKKDLVNFTDLGRDISSQGELEIMKILKTNTPIWIKNYDRDRVAFYQKPDPDNLDKVINADLCFPPLIEGAFGGEILGCGQRQDNADELIESIERQNLSKEAYEWYIDLRRLPEYQTTSGFGLGIERFITWSLCRDDIKDAIIYPRLKNVVTYP